MGPYRFLPFLALFGVCCYMLFTTQVESDLLHSEHQSPPPVPYHLLNDSQAQTLTNELVDLAPDDDTSLMDIHDFRWLIGGEAPADGCRPLILVLVHTALDHVEHRQIIRETWGAAAAAPAGSSKEMMIRFLVGQPSGEHAAEVQRNVSREAAAFGDLVQGSFVDAYRNMTYKHAMALKWFATRCPGASYVLKVDDDVLVNTPVLLDFVRRTLSPYGARRLLACSVQMNARPKRTWRSKWRVGFTEYAQAEYPPYCAGWVVLYSPDVALDLYRLVQREPYFWIDDVLITGVLAERIGVTHASWEGLVIMDAWQIQELLKDEPEQQQNQQQEEQSGPDFIMALWPADVERGLQRKVWARLKDGNSNAIYRDGRAPTGDTLVTQV